MPASSTTEVLYAVTVAERRRLVAVLQGLEPAGWDHASLCEGWRVREVTAHLTMAYRYSGWAVGWGVVKAHGSFARFADHAARHDASVMSADDLLRSLATNVEHTWRPPGGGQAGALTHDVIHGLDITEPLGLEAPPIATIRHVLDHFGPRNLKFFGVDLDGHRLEAADTNWHLGRGETIRLLAKDILLLVTAREPLPDPTTT
ncbi:maleylpyruvate isomerase family mycothiol-dependent enzyme [Rhodococcus sp. H29-C3]|uniref:maleylpyruvate isomerase family mycothiol-dependent enzyme n=1 Tax=Rhodococcus sp. H29-C3 TaxID=3046307 RepID=UPI0024B8EE06|nr:maleylpyruvate isomerase family mycothiol-dependent enzyme [Rhodococcus sp. H29-C3]MDJ0363402.1 maleylpyruvate isomerase family mycothiol-dependent enzyme [Rhodococcus sp. H29-C3]